MKKIFILFMVLLICGEISEVSEQHLKYGENIEQYAVVKVIASNGVPYFKPCSDCTAKITVQKDNGNIVLFNQDMTDKGSALFTYQTNPTFLDINRWYRVIVNISSPLYGNGSVDSRIIIEDVQTTNIIADTPITTTDKDLGNELSDASIKEKVKMVMDFINPSENIPKSFLSIETLLYVVRYIIYLPIYLMNITGILYGLFGFILIITNLIGFALTAALTLLKIFSQILIFLENPKDYIYNVFIPYILDIGWTFVLLYIVWCLFIEIIFIGITVMLKPDDDIIGMGVTYVTLHFKAVQYVLMFFYYLVNFIMTLIVNILRFVIPVGGH